VIALVVGAVLVFWAVVAAARYRDANMCVSLASAAIAIVLESLTR
jgi:hypothetical protein